MKVLIVEDSLEIRILVESALAGLDLRFAGTLAEAYSALESQKWDLLLLDLSLPDGDGMKLLATLPKDQTGESIPVFILSGRNDTANKVLAFSVGAEDFIAKPFDPLELRARVQAKLQRRQKEKAATEVVTVGDLRIELLQQKAFRMDKQKRIGMDLTSLEFRLLTTFAKTPERVFSRDFLLDKVWGSGVTVTDRTVDTHIGHLRKKLHGSNCEIETVIGSGYRFVVSSH
jgi:DNA-binding response OmpR family regulator